MSKHIVSINLLNLQTDSVPCDIEYVKLYFKQEHLTQINNTGDVKDVVLDRILDGFSVVPAAPILTTDTVLEAFEKIQATLIAISGNYLELDDYLRCRVLEFNDDIENIVPTDLYPNDSNPGNQVIKILTNDVIEYWERTSTGYTLLRTIRPVILDGHRINIIRNDNIQGIEPTGTEIPSPIDGDTAVIFLDNGIIEYWAYSSLSWSLVNTIMPAVLDGNDTHIDRTGNVSDTTVPPTSTEVPSPQYGDTAKIKFDNNIIEFWHYDNTNWVFDFIIQGSSSSDMFIDVRNMPLDVGGWEAGSSFPTPGVQLLEMWRTLLYPYLYPSFTSYSSASLFTTFEVGTDIANTYSVSYGINHRENVDTSVLGTMNPLVSNPAIPIETFTIEDLPNPLLPFNYAITTYNIGLEIINWKLEAMNNKQPTAGHFDIAKQTYGRYYIWMWDGLVNDSPTDSAGVRAISDKHFLNGDNKGTFQRPIPISAQEFSFYIPDSGQSIQVIDNGNLNNDVTAAFSMTTITVEDANGVNVNYRKYTIYLGMTGLPNANFNIKIL